MTTKTKVGKDGVTRCSWPGDDEIYIRYHDLEWGFPKGDDRELFEKVCLEGFQAGLSWITILRKREEFRKAFSNFDFSLIASYGEKEVERLMENKGIVRHEGKIRSVINNSQRAEELVEQMGSLSTYFWGFSHLSFERNHDPIPAKTALSEEISEDLKKRGWSWVGPTTIYSFMQATGIVNDHYLECDIHKTVDTKQKLFKEGMKLI